MTALGTAATNFVAPDTGAKLDLATSQLAAVFVAFGIAFAATTPNYGRLGDLYGQQTPLLDGITAMTSVHCSPLPLPTSRSSLSIASSTNPATTENAHSGTESAALSRNKPNR